MYPDDAIQPQPLSAAPPVANPWERRAQGEAVRALWDTLVMSLSRPGDLFRGTPRSGGLGAPLAYAAILGTVGIVAQSLWQIGFRALSALLSSRLNPDAASPSAHGEIFTLAVPFVVLVLSPLLITVGLFIGAGLTHLALMMLGGDRHGFEGTFRGMAYAHGPMVFYVIPLVGVVIGGVWAAVLQVLGISKLQETEWWRALLAILLFPCASAMIGIIAAIPIAALIA